MPGLNWAIVAVAGVMVACSARAPVADTLPGCYRFDRPISYSATGEREAGDSAWYVLRLLPTGGVQRPAMSAPARERFAQRSSWRAAEDSLHIRVFDGIVGWDLDLARQGDRYQGTGTYLSDAIAIGREPYTATFRTKRTGCAIAP
jgi:hypothetical protein